MIWPWRRTLKLIYLPPFHLSNYICAAFGTPSWAARTALTYGISTTRLVSLVLRVSKTLAFYFPWNQGHSRQWNGGGREIDEGKHPDGSEADGVEDKSIVEDMEDDGPWYLGKAKEEYKRKLGLDTTTVQEIEDPIQVDSFIYFCTLHAD